MIDRGLRPWPQELTETLDRFVQGDIVEAPAFTFIGSRGAPLWGEGDAEAGEGDEESCSTELSSVHEIDVVELPPSSEQQLGIITTNTCDLCEAGPPEQPWFQVSPVYTVATEATTLKQYLVQLDPPELPAATWVADLRLEVAVEKTWLLGKTPIKSFRSEEGYLTLGRALGRRRDRAALADHLVDAVAASLRKRKSNNSSFKKAFKDVQSVRLAIPRGERLAPLEARVHVVTRGPISHRNRERFDSWWDQARLACEQVGIILLPSEFHDGRAMDVELFASLIDLNIK